jgi:hypothetical protein
MYDGANGVADGNLQSLSLGSFVLHHEGKAQCRFAWNLTLSTCAW